MGVGGEWGSEREREIKQEHNSVRRCREAFSNTFLPLSVPRSPILPFLLKSRIKSLCLPYHSSSHLLSNCATVSAFV